MKFNLRRVGLLLLVGGASISAPAIPAAAQTNYTIDHHLSRIEGSIKYTVVGRYVARFDDYSGKFLFDPANLPKSSVELSIVTASIVSAHPSLDRIVRSAQLLDVKKFPLTIFKSKSISHRQEDPPNNYWVTGDLSLHGVTKEISFPFIVDGLQGDHQNRYLKARGVWVISRKDFNIYWHPFLDQGGILVGNHLVVNWEIVAMP